MGEYMNKWLPVLKAESKPVITAQDNKFNLKRKCLDCGMEYESEQRPLWGASFDITGPRCPICKEKLAQKYLTDEKACLLSAVAAQRKHWRDTSGIDRKYMLSDFDNFQSVKTGNVNKAKTLCQQYAYDYPLMYREYLKNNNKAFRSMVLFSTLDQCGVGKTHLVSAVLHTVLNRWKGEGMQVESRDTNDMPHKWQCTMVNPVLFVSEPELYLNIRLTYNYNPEEKQRLDSETDILNRLIWRDLLVIDDIGKVQQRDMDFVQKTLYAIINGRYKNLRPVILTTNKTPDQLKTYIGEASFDRIYEMCHGKFFQVEGESFRTKKEAWG